MIAPPPERSTDPPSQSPVRWHQTARGRRELLIVVGFVAANLGFPVIRTEFFPFSRAPMFWNAPQVYCEYRVVAPDGTALPVADFGLQRNYWGNPVGVGVGIRPPETVDVFGEVASEKAVVTQVKKRLAAFPELRFVDVEQDVIGPLDTGEVGSIARHHWRVDNPHPDGTTP